MKSYELQIKYLMPLKYYYEPMCAVADNQMTIKYVSEDELKKDYNALKQAINLGEKIFEFGNKAGTQCTINLSLVAAVYTEVKEI